MIGEISSRQVYLAFGSTDLRKSIERVIKANSASSKTTASAFRWNYHTDQTQGFGIAVTDELVQLEQKMKGLQK